MILNYNKSIMIKFHMIILWNILMMNQIIPYNQSLPSTQIHFAKVVSRFLIIFFMNNQIRILQDPHVFYEGCFHTWLILNNSSRIR